MPVPLRAISIAYITRPLSLRKVTPTAPKVMKAGSPNSQSYIGNDFRYTTTIFKRLPLMPNTTGKTTARNARADYASRH